MNYFDRLLRRLALDGEGVPSRAIDDPFDRTAEWPLDVMPATANLPATSDSAAQPDVSTPTAMPQPPQLLVPAASDSPAAVLGQAGDESPTAIQPTARPSEFVPLAGAAETVTPIREPAPPPAAALTPLAVADAFFASLDRSGRQPDHDVMPRVLQPDERIVTADRLTDEVPAIEIPVPGMQCVLPTPPPPPPLESPGDMDADVSIGRIEVIVEREKTREAVMPAPRVIIIPAAASRSAPATAGPSSQRFGLGQV